MYILSNNVVAVEFDRESVGSGLVLKHSYCPLSVGLSNCGWAEIGASDGKWYNATQSIQSKLLLTSIDLTLYL